MGNSKSTKNESTKNEPTKTKSIVKDREQELQRKMKLSQILHILTIEGDAVTLDIALAKIMEPIEPYYGMSLYHSFVAGSAFKAKYDVDAVFQILKKHQDVIGDIDHLNTFTKNIIFHRWNRRKYNKSTKEYTDLIDYTTVTMLFSVDGVQKLAYDGTESTGWWDDKVSESKGFFDHATITYNINNTTPLLFAFGVRNLSHVIKSNIDEVITLLNKNDTEKIPPPYDKVCK